MTPFWKQITWIVALAALVFFLNLGKPRLWDRDEPRNAGCAAEMLARGDWVVPMFNHELRPHKPVLLYWFMMVSYKIFGVSEFSARFSSALLGVGTVLMTYWIGRRIFNAAAGFWAALVLCSTLMFTVSARAATPDSLLTFFSTMSLLVFVKSTFPNLVGIKESASSSERKLVEPDERLFPTQWSTIFLMYALMGVAVLAKGPVGVVLPVAVIGLYLLIARWPHPKANVAYRCRADAESWIAWLRPASARHFLRTCGYMRPLTALLAVSVVALPWYSLVTGRTDGQWLRAFLIDHNLGRALQPMEGHSGPIFYYVIAVLVGFFPWSIFATPVVISTIKHWRKGEWRYGYLFTSCWIGAYLLIFTVARTKLPSYVTPAYPALALLTGAFIYRFQEGLDGVNIRWMKAAVGCLVLVGIAILVALPVAAQEYLPGDEWLGAVGLIPVLAGCVLFWTLVQENRQAFVHRMLLSSTAFVLSLFAFASVRVDHHQYADRLLQVVENHSPDVSLAAFGSLEPSWVFYSGKPIRHYRIREQQELVEFLVKDRRRLVITREKDFRRIEAKLPGNIGVLDSVPYFLNDGDLLLVGRDAASVGIAERSADRPSGIR